MEMLIVEKSFFDKNKNYKKGLKKAGFNVTKSGVYFCDKNTINEFPELFKGVEIKYINVTQEDIENDVTDKKG